MSTHGNGASRPAPHSTPACRLAGLWAGLLLATQLALFLPSPSLAADRDAGALRFGGRAVGEDHQPLAGAAIEVLPDLTSYEVGLLALEGDPLPGVLARASSDEEGFFHLRAPGAGVYRLRAAAEGFGPTDFRNLLASDGEQRGTLTLRPRREIEVRLTGPGGRPVEGALVLAAATVPQRFRIQRRDGWRSLLFRGGRSGEDGRVTLTAAEGQVLRLAAVAPGLAPSEVVESEGDETAVTLELRSGRQRILEVRSPGGEPRAQALVRVGAMALPAGLTGEDGRFTAVVIPGEVLPVTVEAPGGLWARGTLSLPPEVEEGAMEPPPVVLELRPPLAAAGRVVAGPERAPLGGVRIWSRALPGVLAVSGRDGGYGLSLPGDLEEELDLEASVEGYLPATATLEAGALGRGSAPVFSLQPAAAVTGVVVDGEGRPVPEVLITAATEGRRGARRVPPRYARSAKDGRFRLTVLSPDTLYTLEAVKTGFAPGREELLPLEEGQTREGLRLVLRRGLTAVGRVLDEEQQPVAGAQVRLAPLPEGGEGISQLSARWRGAREARPVTSDEEGRFVVEDLAPGRFDLHVQAEGLAPALVPGVEIPDGEGPVDLGEVELEAGLSLEGRVVDSSGDPVAGVRVAATQMSVVRAAAGSARRAVPEAYTGAAGRFRVVGLRAGEPAQLTVEREGYATRRLPWVAIPPPEPLEIVLEPGSTVAGLVVGGDGEPVAGARVTAEAADAGPGSAPASWRQSAVTDEEGRFEITDIAGGKLWLQAQARGLLPGEKVPVEVPSGGVLDNVRLTLEAGATVLGRVRSPDGEPVAGARIEVLAGDRSFGRRSFLSRSDTATDGDGRYRLEGVPTGPQSLAATQQDYARAVRDLDVRPGENRLDFELAAGWEVAGRVIDAAGAPVPGSAVTLRPAEGSRQETTSGPDGAFAFQGVAEGTWRLRAEKPGQGVGEVPQPLTVAGADLTGLEIRLEAGGRLLGRVLGLTLDELAEVQVFAHSPGQGMRLAQPDYEGAFVFEGLAAGDWRIAAMHPSRGQVMLEEPVTVTSGSEASVELEFPSGGLTLRGVVLRADEPVAGVMVSLSSPEKPFVGSTPTAHDGRFRFEGLEPGNYRLRVTSRFGASLHHEESLELTTDREVVVELASDVLEGRVIDDLELRPLAGVRVSLVPAGEAQESLVLFRDETTTDATGAFRFAAVPPGSWRLEAVEPGYARAELQVEISEGVAPQAVEVRLSPAEGAVIQILAPAGLATAERVEVVASDAGGGVGLSGAFPVGEAGRVRLASLPDGVWKVRVWLGDTVGTGTVRAPGPPVPIALVPGATLALSVPALEDSAALAHVEIRDAAGRLFQRPSFGGALLSRPSFVGGSVSVTGLPAGSWSVLVTAADGRLWSGSVTTASGAEAGLVLE